MLQSREKYFDNLAMLPAALRSYIPKQLLKNVKIEGCFVRNELEFVQKLLDNSNDNLRMYGSAESLWRNLKVHMKFPLSRKMFPLGMGNYHSTIPNIYQNLKKEVLYCKQDLLFYLQSCVYAELELRDDEQKVKFAELIEYMKNHEKRLSGCYEFVKYDHDVFEDIREPFLCSRSLYVFPEKEVVTAVERVETQLTFYEEKDFVNVFENLISKYPCLFLPNSETKNKNATAVVRIFDDGGLKFVMESELFAAINLKNPGQKPQCMDVKGHYRTIDYKHVLKSYRDQIGDIDFIYHPIPLGFHAAVPIVAPTGDHCILAADAHMDIIRETFIIGVFQKITQNTCNMIPKFIAILRKYFPSNIKYRYFINLKLLQKLREELEEFWKPIEDKPVKRVRDVGPQGFTVEDFKKELKYLGYNKIFPEIIGDARAAYTFFDPQKPSELKTSDMFAAIQGSLTLVLTKRFPCINVFMFRQKICLHNRRKLCELCSKAIKEAEVQIEAEIKAESEEASSSVTATISGDDAKKKEHSEESKPEPVTSEALPIVRRDPENLKNSVDSSFVEAETKSIPAISESEVSEHNPVLSNSNNQKIPRESCSKATKESEFEQAPSTVTATTLGNVVKKEESITSEAPSVAIDNPVEDETNSLTAISEPEVLEHNPVLPESNDQKISMHHRLEPRESCLKATKEGKFEQASSSVTATTSGGDAEKEEDSEKSKHESVTNEAPEKTINNPVGAETNPLPANSESKVPEHDTVLPDYNTHVCEKCMETSNEAREEVKQTYRKMISQAKKHNEQLELTQKAREEVVETYRKMVVLEKTLKEKDTEMERLRVYEEKSKKPDETEKKMKGLEKEAEEWKMKYFKILEENEKMGNMLKSSVNSKALKSQVKEKNEQLKKAQKALEEKKQRCKELEKTIKEKEEEVRNLTEAEKWEIQNKEDYKATVKELDLQIKRNASKSADEIKKLTAEKERAENLLKRTNKGLLEKLQKSESSLKEMINRLTHLETDVTEKNRMILELQKSAENQVSEQEKTKKELEARISKILAVCYEISPPEPNFKEKPDTECLICLDEMRRDQKKLKCEHCRKIVHLECASEWLKNHRSCAHCRREQLDPTEFPSLQ